MKTEQFRHYLKSVKNMSYPTVSSRISNCRNVEKHLGNLDDHYHNGTLSTLSFSRIPIAGNRYTGEATLRSAVQRYKEFKEWAS